MPRGNFGHDATYVMHYVVLRDNHAIADTIAFDARNARQKLRPFMLPGDAIYLRLGNEAPLPEGHTTTTGETVSC